MKKLLILTGVVAALGLLSAYAGGIANPENLSARAAVLDAGKVPSTCACPCPQCGSAPCCCKAACPKAVTGSKATTCSKTATCPKGSKAAASCPVAKDDAKACPKAGSRCKAQKTPSPEKATDKPQN